jgi:CheY-like chemotaxis protein
VTPAAAAKSVAQAEPEALRGSGAPSAAAARPHRPLTRPAATTLTRARTLVVDSNPPSRSLTCMQLRDLGIGDLQQAARAADVRLALEREAFDIVLCSMDVADGDTGWQDLFDELRRAGLLPHSTVLFIITAEATYAKVREAAEAALDGYLLRPYNAATLGERLQQAWRRKQEMAPLLAALRDGREPEALAWCLDSVRRRRRHALFAARVACELLMKMERPGEVIDLCESLDDPEADAGGASDWRHLNVVRAWHMRGETRRARRMCDEFVAANIHNADGFDLQAQLQAEAGELESALNAARASVQLTPGCVLRLQTCGALAFYADQSASAQQMLTRAVSLGLRSRLFDALSLALLGLVQFDQSDSKYLPVTRSHLSHYLRRYEGSPRLQRFDTMLTALRHLQLREYDAAADEARKLDAQAMTDGFDLEAAVITLALWSRFPHRELESGAIERLVREVGLRHGGVRSAHETLMACARRQPQMVLTLESCHQQSLQLAENSLSRSLAGQPLQAVQALLEHGRGWRSAKLLEMSMLVARRHAATLGAEGAALADEAGQALAMLPVNIIPIAGLRRTGRSAGGLIMRR